MKVQLKQPEIIEALKGYLNSQGINVQGKDVTVDFTAGRKESGLSAEINITDRPAAELTSKVVVHRNPVAVVPASALPAATPDAAVEGEQPEAQAVEPVKASLFA